MNLYSVILIASIGVLLLGMDIYYSIKYYKIDKRLLALKLDEYPSNCTECGFPIHPPFRLVNEGAYTFYTQRYHLYETNCAKCGKIYKKIIKIEGV